MPIELQIFLIVSASSMLGGHLVKPGELVKQLVVMVAIVAAFYFGAVFRRDTVALWDLILIVTCYSVGLFALICEALVSGLGARLTRWRGKHWVKEIDYVYLLLGSVGVLGTLNRIDKVTDRLSGYELVAPMILATAIVLRLVKTRAEIAGWNEPSHYVRS